MSRDSLVYDVRFAPNQKLPPGYRVVWSEHVEHYMWLNGDRESAITWNRWQAYRWAWADYRAGSTRRGGE